MYNSFFKLQSSPFGTSPDPRFLYMMPHTREALACLEYGISARKGFTVLTGEVGTGKTTLLRRALSSFSNRRVSTAFVFNPRLDVLDFLEFVLTDFGLVPQTRTKSGMLLLLTNLETSSEKLLQIVLSGQPELEEKLRHPSVRQLRQRVSLWCRTQALTESQTHAYVAERLRIAGASWPLFSLEALDLVHRFSRGIPRIINLLCEHSLILAYVEQVRQVTAAIVESVAAELELELQPFMLSSAALGSAPLSTRSATEDNFTAAFNRETPGRQDR